MSFSSDIKNEVTRLEYTKTEYIAELSSIVRNNGIITDTKIIITIENNGVARRIYKLFKNNYDVNVKISVRKGYGFSKSLTYILTISENVLTILNDLSIMDENKNYLSIPKSYIVSDDDQIRAYLRGLFISVGSVNDPKTSRYHLEFLVDDNDYANFICELLNNYDLNSKVIKRDKNYMIYIKAAEKISDFLRIIKSYNAVMYFEDIRIYRDHKNMTNRFNNCEQANIDKVFITSNNQIKDINVILNNDLYDLIDEKLKIVIDYRLKYPESSLKELSEIMSLETKNKITKSGLNHRFRKIREIVGGINGKNN